MPKAKEIVINTGPIIALVAALGELTILKDLYNRVLVPYEVAQEILVGGSKQFAIPQFTQANWLQIWAVPLEISPFLSNSLDLGEASVIQLAINEKVNTVCIDEAAGRRVARLNNLSLTGSVGILLRAKREGHSFSMETAIQRMQDQGVWLSNTVINFALAQSGEGGKGKDNH
ncbi:MAG: DUF3368 domain-containing protein [Anaerolineae bacterium]|nr:DUF3368 domain-containing protein [Anaerolineae bacterium]